VEVGSTLTYQDFTGVYNLTVVALYTKALSV
jgi:hypothetical protein